MFKISRKSLDLDKVLPMGMAFRWKKIESTSEWAGPIGSNLYIFKQSENFIDVKVIPEIEDFEKVLIYYFDLERKYSMPKDDSHFKEAFENFGTGIRQLQAQGSRKKHLRLDSGTDGFFKGFQCLCAKRPKNEHNFEKNFFLGIA